MSNNSLTQEIEKDFAQLQQDFRAHHWLLATTLVVALFALSTLWKLSDLRQAMFTNAAIVEKLSGSNEQLEKQLATLRQEVADLRQLTEARSGAPTQASSGATQQAAPSPLNIAPGGAARTRQHR